MCLMAGCKTRTRIHVGTPDLKLIKAWQRFQPCSSLLPTKRLIEALAVHLRSRVVCSCCHRGPHGRGRAVSYHLTVIVVLLGLLTGDDSSIGLVAKMTPVGTGVIFCWRRDLLESFSEKRPSREENLILQLVKGPPRAPAAREAAALLYPRGGSRPPPNPPGSGDVFDVDLCMFGRAGGLLDRNMAKY